MKKISIEEKYQFYLKKINLSETTMHPEQKRQLRHAFYGSAGILLIALRDELTELDEEESIECLDDMMKQVGDFVNNKN